MPSATADPNAGHYTHISTPFPSLGSTHVAVEQQGEVVVALQETLCRQHRRAVQRHGSMQLHRHARSLGTAGLTLRGFDRQQPREKKRKEDKSKPFS
jgi:hypothetical protein